MAARKLSGYQKYLNRRERMIDKGYILREAMSESEFYQSVGFIENEKKSGRLITKKSAEQYVIAEADKYFTKNQAKALKMGINDMFKDKGIRDEEGNIRKINVDFIYRNKETMSLISDFTAWKSGKFLVGGHYE